MLKLYENSLAIVLILLFVASFILHLYGGVRAHNVEIAADGKTPISMVDFLQTSTFWFQSFQNWQSEFLAVASLVLLSIFLRQKHSPQSKPVDAPNSQTGA